MTDVMKIIRNERHRQGLSQVDLAKKIYVHPTSVSFWESYRFSPKFDIVEDMLNALGMEIIIQKKEPKDESQYDFGEYADRLWKIAYERGKREALEQTEPSCDTCRNKGVEGCEQPCLGCGCCGLYEPKDEPQTERSE